MDQPTQQKQNTDQGIKYTLALPNALADTNAPDSTSQAFVPQGKWVRKADRTKETVDKAEADGQPDEVGFVARVERGVGAAGKKRPQRPNFFLSTRLDADGLQASFQEFAKHVKGKHPEYSKLLIPPEQIHITLFTVHLADDEAIDRAGRCLTESVEIIKTFYSDGPPSLRFMGIGAFGKGRVIYTPPLLGPDIGRFGDLTRALRSRFREAGMDSGDREEFVVHATLMKVREGDKVWVKGKGKKIVRKVPEEVVEKFRDFDFGTQTFRSIELSAMILPKVDGYYQCFARVPF